MYTALYRTCRPETFEGVLGQEHVVKILKNQVACGTVSHAYLFCGTRGTGKTTTARILAKAVNCLSDGERPCGRCPACEAIRDGNYMDVIEIDAASNNGVENIRELRESVKYPPAAGRKKVYIIDEVHMLSTEAFNALLKTLEEPPEHVMFILATTEPQKLPATILSRCMRLDFRRVPQDVIDGNMRELCADRGVEITPEASLLLANCADGSVRDGLSLLDQVLAGGDKFVDREKVLEYVGVTGEDFFIDITGLTLEGKSAEALLLLNRVIQEGKDVKQIMKDWVSHYRSLLIAKFVENPADMLNMSMENLEKVAEQSRNISTEQIDFAVRKLSGTINDARWSANPRVLLELAIVSIAMGADYGKAADALEYRPGPVKKSNEGQERQKNIQPDSAAETKGERLQPSDNTKSRLPDDTKSKPSDNIESKPSVKTDLETLWQKVLDGAAESVGSINLIRGGTKLIHMGEAGFTIEANSSFTKRYAEERRTELEEAMFRAVGRRLKLLCNIKDEKPVGGNGYNPDEVAELASKRLGIHVDVE